MPDHRSPEAQRYRALYRTARWLSVRKAQLNAHPLCKRCQDMGRVAAATICHHVDPSTKDSPATFYVGPFESLCKPCHDGPAQQVERMGYESTIGPDGWPTDPRHPANVATPYMRRN